MKRFKVCLEYLIDVGSLACEKVKSVDFYLHMFETGPLLSILIFIYRNYYRNLEILDQGNFYC